MAQSHLQKLNCRCEVTAVKFICDGQFLLTGQGPFLTLYDASNGSYITSLQLLSANKIHGIRAYPVILNETTFIIIFCFGARELSISAFNPNTRNINALHSPLLLTDWIFDTSLLTTTTNPTPTSATFELAVGMMHSQVLVYLLTFNLIPSAPSSPPTPPTSKIELIYKLMETIHSENTSILYSVSFHGTNRENLMVAAGDCFNHVMFPLILRKCVFIVFQLRLFLNDLKFQTVIAMERIPISISIPFQIQIQNSNGQ